MKKQTQKIATNTSSGAEKVEKIQKQTQKRVTPNDKNATVKTKQTLTAKGDAALGDSLPQKEQSNPNLGKAEKESIAAKARVQKAIAKKQEQEKRKLARQQKAKERKEQKQKRRAEKAKSKQLRAKKRAERVKTKRVKQKRKKENKDHDQRRERRAEGYGGWIAAVVTLGVVTLALATTATVGAIENKRTTDAVISSYRGTMYELTGILSNVEKDLDRARVSNSSAQQSRILTDLLVQARLAELDIEKLPIPVQTSKNVSAFVNRAAAECEKMLTKLRNGEQLTQEDRQGIERLYRATHAVCAQANELLSNISEEEITLYIKKGKGKIADALDALGGLTLQENAPTMNKAERPPKDDNIPPKDKQKRLQTTEAEKLCRQYFQSYEIEEFQCVGETVTKGYNAYNVQGYDKNGDLLFAEIDQKSGALIGFDYYQECDGETFDMPNAQRIAEQFLEGLGYEDMEIVRCRQNGTTAVFTFVYEEDDIVYYPDEIQVKVCRTRGIVSGMDASKYLKNHKGRYEMNAKITLADAYDTLYQGLQVEGVRLAVVNTARGERLAYETICSYQKDKYLVYIDAQNGQEISILNIQDII